MVKENGLVVMLMLTLAGNRNQFLRAYLRRFRGVAKKYLQGYLDFLALLLNEREDWYDLILSDNLGG